MELIEFSDAFWLAKKEDKEVLIISICELKFDYTFLAYLSTLAIEVLISSLNSII